MSKHKRGWLPEWVVPIVVLLFGITFVTQPFVIPTASMENRLLIGDHILVDKLAFAPPGPVSRYLLPYTDVRRGDLIVFRFPLNLRENYVKRAIGLPGDRIRIENRQVYVNGKPLDEPYKIHSAPGIEPYRDNFPAPPAGPVAERAMEMLLAHVSGNELVIPPGHYFGLGDNRDDSLDSRYWGLIPRENIIGKPLLVFWSYDAPTERLADRLRWDNFTDLVRNFFTKTRWNRTFKLIRGHRYS